MKKSKWVLLLGLYATSLLVLSLGIPVIEGYERYQDGCNIAGTCHGAFTDSTSTKGSVFPGDDKHGMHKDNSSMNTACDLCHTQGDNRNAYIGSSNGTNDTPGLGCNGCHEPKGMKRHHDVNGVDWCFECHTNFVPPTEDVLPVYYGGPDTDVDGPCNDVPAANTNENWTIGDLIGLDNDGDNDYDTTDSDCASPSAAGRVPEDALHSGTPLTLDKAAGTQIRLDWGLSCLGGDNDYEVYEGTIAPPFDTHQIVVCSTSGATTTTMAPAGVATYYLIVPTDGTVEGSYGINSAGAERAAAGTPCLTQTIGPCL